MKPPKVVLISAVIVALLAALMVWRGLLSLKRHALHEPGSKPDEPAAAVAAGSSMKESSPASAIKRLLEGGELPLLSAGQLAAFVEKQKHSAASLLAAWQLGGDATWLDEAARRYPDDPRVALMKLGTMNETSAEMREWVQRLKQADPANAVGWCYEAMGAFKDGSPEAARAALAEAARLGRMDAYAKESAEGLTEAYRSSGMDALAAEVLGSSGVMLPQMQLAMNLQKEAITQLGGSLDDGLVQDMLKLAKVVRGSDEGGVLIGKLVGVAMERKMMGELNTLDLIPGTKKFVLERLGELDAERTLVRDLVRKTGPLMSSLGDSELRQYFKRASVEGEMKAMQWLLAQRPEAK